MSSPVAELGGGGGGGGGLFSYPDPNVRNDDYRLHIVSDNHRYVHLGLGTRLGGGSRRGFGPPCTVASVLGPPPPNQCLDIPSVLP